MATKKNDRQWTRDVVTLTVGVALLTIGAFVLMRGFEMPQTNAPATAVQTQLSAQ